MQDIWKCLYHFCSQERLNWNLKRFWFKKLHRQQSRIGVEMPLCPDLLCLWVMGFLDIRRMYVATLHASIEKVKCLMPLVFKRGTPFRTLPKYRGGLNQIWHKVSSKHVNLQANWRPNSEYAANSLLASNGLAEAVATFWRTRTVGSFPAMNMKFRRIFHSFHSGPVGRFLILTARPRQCSLHSTRFCKWRPMPLLFVDIHLGVLPCIP